MNRPSRSDDTTEHPTWNQNPPFLAPDLTTCEDLNGMANVREHRRAGGTDVDGQIGAGMVEHVPVQEFKPPAAKGGCATRCRGQTYAGFCPPYKETMTMTLGQYVLPTSSDSPVCRRSKAVLSWAAWVLSVLATSALLNYLSNSGFLSLFSSLGFSPLAIQELEPIKTSAPNSLISEPALHQLKKRSTCGTGQPISEEEYDTPLHVGALIIVLVVSSLACAFSIIMQRIPWVKIPANFFFAIRHFGTGVLIATAFVHLLPTAFTYLGDPCLSEFWTEEYPAMPGAIALAGIFLVAVIEMAFSPHRHIHSRSAMSAPSQSATTGTESGPSADSDMDIESLSSPQNTAGPKVSVVREMGTLRGRSLSISRQLSQIGADISLPKNPVDKPRTNFEADDVGPDGIVQKLHVTSEQQHKKDILQCMLLEMGILFHSVFIGMALSVSVGKEFIILLIAIVFHQSFEGLALGARIAAIDWPKGSWQPWMMALAYGCTTPIGQAIGLGLHTLYDPEGEVGLILVGTMNAISSGLLVFASLIELLSEDFLSDESWKILRGKKRVVACLLVFAGAFGMSLVGAWA